MGNIVNGVDLIKKNTKGSFWSHNSFDYFSIWSKNGKNWKRCSVVKWSSFSLWILAILEKYWDRDVKRFLNFFTEIDSKKIENIFIKEKNINNLKILLANEATKILHGEQASKKAEQTAKDTFESGGLGADLPEIKIKSKDIQKGVKILDFIANNNILPSKSEARRAIANKGFKIDNIIIDDEKKILELKDFKKKVLKLSYGKKKHFLIKII